MVFIIVLTVVSLDQLTKFLIVRNLALNQSIPLIQGVFHLSLVHNRGAAFGILKNQTPLFIFTSILAVALIFRSLKKNGAPLGLKAEVPCMAEYLSGQVYPRPEGRGFWPRKYEHKKIYLVALSLILAGALGNLIDRLFFGYVIDFLDFRVWPVFNIADSAITTGAVLLGICILGEKKEAKI
jgi:signal peptidase II